MLPEPPARRSKFYYYVGKIIFDFPKKVMGKILFSPVSVPLSKCSTVGQGRSGVRFPPGPVSLGIQLCLSMCLLSFLRRSLMDQLSFVLCFRSLHVPHASITLLSALSAPLSLGRSLLHQLRFHFTFPFF